MEPRRNAVNVLIGNQLIGKSQIKRVKILHGSHISLGNEVIFIDPYKGIQGDNKERLFVTEYNFFAFLPLVLMT